MPNLEYALKELAIARESVRVYARLTDAAEDVLRVELASLREGDRRATPLATSLLDVAGRGVALREEEQRIAAEVARIAHERKALHAERSVTIAMPPAGRRPARQSPAFYASVLAAPLCALLFLSVSVAGSRGRAHGAAPPVSTHASVAIGRVPPVAPAYIAPPASRLPAPPPGFGWAVVYGPAGTTISDDRRDLGVTPLLLALPRGHHTLRATAPNDRSWSRSSSFDVVAGEPTNVSFNDELATRVR